MSRIVTNAKLKPLGLAIAGCLISSGLQAATLTVTNSLNAGEGSLRWAVETANGNADPDNQIIFDPAIDGETIVLASVIEIDKSVTITGNGVAETVISGTGNARLLDITLNAEEVTLSHITLTESVGGMGTGGAITNASPALRVLHSHITNNTTTYQGGGILHRSIAENAFLYVGQSLIDGNTVTGTESWNRGGGIHAVMMREDEAVRVRETVVSNNQAFRGGGISIEIPLTAYVPLMRTQIQSSRLENNTATDIGGGFLADTMGPHSTFFQMSTIRGNHAGNRGGGVYVGSQAFVINSLIADNTAGTSGAGLFLQFNGYGNGVEESFGIANSTISGNATSNISFNSGAGLMIRSSDGSAPPYSFLIQHSTIAFNSSSGSLLGSPGLGIRNDTPWSLDLRHTIVSDNRHLANNHDLDGDFSAQWSILGSRTTATSVTEGPGTINSLEGGLQPLADNGGFSFTHAVNPSGPAFMGGDPDLVTPYIFDQRGMPEFPRISNGRIDIGAFESQLDPDVVFASGFEAD